VQVDGAPGVYGDAATVSPLNSDADNVPDYLDLDSDNDGLFDVTEGGNAGTDVNEDGIVDCIPGSYVACDPDLDGILEQVDGAPTVIGDAISPALPDSNGNGTPDYREVNGSVIPGSDTDFDGIMNTPGYDTDAKFGGNRAAAVVLPVTIAQFKAKKSDGSVVLDWQVGVEIDVRSYEVMRSEDGANFTVIGKVAATGNAAYQFVDKAPNSGINYYKLKITDNDRSFKYSVIVSVRMNGKMNQLSVFPNPVTTRFTIDLGGLTDGKYQMEIHNISGQTVYRQSIMVNGQSITLNRPAGVNSGTYVVVIYDTSGELAGKSKMVIR
jgi:hypothetical protein